VEATTVIAAYAGVVSTAALGWQIYSWQHKRRSHVDVEARFALAVLSSRESPAKVIAIGVANHSDHAVRVTGAGLDLQDGSGCQLHHIGQFPGATLPGVVASRDSASAYLPLDQVEAEGINIAMPVTAWARLATGELVKSTPTPLTQTTPP
jgi:hypothetical protein